MKGRRLKRQQKREAEKQKDMQDAQIAKTRLKKREVYYGLILLLSKLKVLEREFARNAIRSLNSF